MISVIIPFFNEAENIPLLHEELKKEFAKLKEKYQILFIDDGSTDGSGKVADGLARFDSSVKVIHQRKQFGKGEALSKGVESAEGDVIIFMDADLQDNPQDIEKFIQKLDEGYDLVNGVRMFRKHNAVIQFYSRMGNGFLRKFSKSPFTDINCGFKAFKKDVMEEIVLYGNNFRFLPLAVFHKGYKVTEVPVQNRPRLHGKAKFGMNKAFVGFIDTLTAYFLFRFSERPLHFFGIIGGIFFLIGTIVTGYLLIEKLFFGTLLYRRPGLQFGILSIIVGFQIVMTGIIGELIVYMHKKRVK